MKWIWYIASLNDFTSLTIYVIVELVDSSGFPKGIPSKKALATLGIGWAAFGLSLIFNILYYALHPSEVTHSSPVFH